MPIGDFARATHLSIKALRHYHQEGLLEPAEIDPVSGYRRYDVAQIPTAQVIRRFRSLGMPLDDIAVIVRTDDLEARNGLIIRHLRRLESELSRTQDAVASLRHLVERPICDSGIRHVHIASRKVLAITQDVAVADIGAWYQGALGELYATLAAQQADLSGDAAGVYADGLFTEEFGTASVYIPARGPVRATGRTQVVEMPEVDLAVIDYVGPEAGVDRAYGALADYVTRHALAVDGPLHEFYPVNRAHTADPSRWRTQIGWPIFEVSPH
ncbi:MerR family transcriptional regulator [Tsukamurella soli]|uniref:MerR family transcriptional regulator n=2 Tax=Tsukamurella soli TaxID=644556 RepID=A0ABP8JU72_9ACTN